MLKKGLVYKVYRPDLQKKLLERVDTWLSLATILLPSGSLTCTEVEGAESSRPKDDCAAFSAAAGSAGGGPAEVAEAPEAAVTPGAMPPRTLPAPVKAFRTPCLVK